jgi:hypothetical protein
VPQELDTFVLYYTCWHEGEFSLTEMRSALIADIGEDGFRLALAEFKKLRLEREKNGDYRTWYQIYGNS